MTKENEQDFDLQLKSMLEDAEVKAPRGVWKAVSAELGAASSPSRVWWSMAGVSLAAACLATAFLIINRGTHNSTLYNNNNENLLAQVETIVSEPVAAEVEEAVAPEEPVMAVKPVRVWKPAAKPAVQPVTEPVGESAAAENAAGSPETAEPDRTEATPCGPATEISLPSEAEAWARIAAEDAKISYKPRIALALEGALGGNDSELLARPARVGRMSSGSSDAGQTGITETSSSTYSIPISCGLGVRVYFAPKWSVGAGVCYTILNRSFSGTYNEVTGGVVTNTVSGDVHHNMGYLGIPVNVYYDFLKTGPVKFYGYAGGSVEFCLSNKYRVTPSEFSSQHEVNFSDPVSKPQLSVDLGIGVELHLFKSVGIYIDPSAHYYLPCDQPKSLRTDKPFMINLEAGLRVNL